MKAIILAGGKGTRLPDSAKEIPKVLVEVDGRPILFWQIEYLVRELGFGEKDIKISLGYKAEKVIDFLKKNDLQCDYVVEKEPLGTGGAIKLASKGFEKDYFVLSGDILCDIDLNSMASNHAHSKDKPLGTLAVYACNDALSYGLVSVAGEKIKEFLEKPKISRSGFINTSVYIFSPDIFSGIQKDAFSIERELFPELSKQGKLQAYIHKGKWIDVGTEERLAWARNNFLKHGR